MFGKSTVVKIFLSLTLMTAVVLTGCGKAEETTVIPPDPFTSTWNLGEEGRGISISGNTAGHEAGEISEFVLKFDNTRGTDTWSGTYCLVLLDRYGIVMELDRGEFTAPSGLAPQTNISAKFDATLHGPYGLSLIIPNRLQQVTTIWVGTLRQGDAGPWPQITNCYSDTSEEAGRALAEEFVLNSPTWIFDGIEGSLVYVKTEDMVTDSGDGSDKPRQFQGWRFTYRFESAQITLYEAVITVENGEITTAVLDGTWDMIAQRMLEE